VGRLVGLNKILQQELISFDRYTQNQIAVLGYQTYKKSDTLVKDVMSYAEWISTYGTFPTVKVEGLESNPGLLKKFKQVKVKNIHLFVNQKTGFSFKWHRDNVNVILYVVSGKKIVYLRNSCTTLVAGQSILIPKRHLHKVFSTGGTVALSVGF
jgi:mannose-6-phosphate isomerase-like protein (cupin superfamily)